MKIKDIFEVGEIMEMDDKAKSIAVLDGDNCVVTGKALNKHKIILHMQRQLDGSEGNVFVRLKDDHHADFPTSKRLLASKNVLGLTLKQVKNFSVEEL